MENNGKRNTFATMKGAKTNWFLTPQQNFSLSNFESSRQRLNGFDSGILEEKIYLNVKDEPLKLEYKIENKEKILKDINEKIKVADSLSNQQELFSLRIKKQRVSNELKDLYKEYSSQNISSKISGGISEAVTEVRHRKMPVINSIKRFIKRNILARISKKFKSIVAIGDSLEVLDSINKNVDELLKIKAPYGETAQNYQKLTEYLYRAHKIRSEINKTVKK